MALYIVLIIAVLIFGYMFKVNSTQKSKKGYLFFFFCIMTVISALRKYSVGADTYQFYTAYQIIGDLDWGSSDLVRYEWGFFALCKLLNLVTGDPQVLIIVTSIFIFSSVAIFIYRNSRDVVLSTYLFLTLNIYFMYMTAMRQAIAIALLMYGFEALKRKKYLRYGIIVLLASSFHLSAITVLPLILFVDKQFTNKHFLFTICIAVTVFILADSVFNIATNIFPQYTIYGGSTFDFSNYFGSVIIAIVSFVILCFGLFYTLKDSSFKNNKMSKILDHQSTSNSLQKKQISYLAFMMSMWFLSSTLVVKINFFNRLTVFFDYYAILWLPEAITFIKDDKERYLMLYFVIILVFTYSLIIMLFRPEWYGVIPYEAFWD